MKQDLAQISLDRIDIDAEKVVRRLIRHGYEAYLVGGCVRDLLLRRIPKDFDVATSATPLEIKKVFRNCRIIGRRFRLAHIFFGSKIVETSTFRTNPNQGQDEESDSEDLLIWRDNVFGTAKEDALRRDFTINGLFFDIQTQRVIDFVGGLEDLRVGTVRTIGDPDIRLQEDPIRILRAIKFATRLGLSVESKTKRALVQHRGLIAKCSVSRVVEEIYKFLRSGHVADSFRMMHETGVLPVLFPELAYVLEPPDSPLAQEPVNAVGWIPRRKRVEAENEEEKSEDICVEALRKNTAKLLEDLDLVSKQARTEASEQLWKNLRAMDGLVRASEVPPEPPLLLGALLSCLVSEACKEDRRFHQTMEQLEKLVTSVCTRVRVSRRHRERLLQILVAQRRFTSGRPKYSVISREYFPQAFQLFQLRHSATGNHEEAVVRWQEVVDKGYHKDRRRKRRPRRSHSPSRASHFSHPPKKGI
ncbi:MAG: polynucleotide adenylyltransferase PcnB [Pseudomonadota bacterium]